MQPVSLESQVEVNIEESLIKSRDHYFHQFSISHGVPFLCQGQTPFDVADESLVEHLEMLQKKQNVVSLWLIL